MENGYGFEVSMSCVYNDGEGYDAGININSSDGRQANYECSANSLNELYEKMATEGIDTLLPIMTKQEKLTPEQELEKKITEMKKEQEKLLAEIATLKEENSLLKNAPKAEKISNNRGQSRSTREVYDFLREYLAK